MQLFGRYEDADAASEFHGGGDMFGVASFDNVADCDAEHVVSGS